ncbi:hypothetical protein K376_07009 [Streptomyces sp. PsTaAH-130]|nr:hypothetical protein K376_07009 [Streptomyces sp. PsTaAH-130]
MDDPVGVDGAGAAAVETPPPPDLAVAEADPEQAASASRGDQLDNARAYAEQHPERCRAVADEQLTDPGVLVQACAALSTVPRGGQGSRPRPEAAAERTAELVLRAANRHR